MTWLRLSAAPPPPPPIRARRRPPPYLAADLSPLAGEEAEAAFPPSPLEDKEEEVVPSDEETQSEDGGGDEECEGEEGGGASTQFVGLTDHGAAAAETISIGCILISLCRNEAAIATVRGPPSSFGRTMRRRQGPCPLRNSTIRPSYGGESALAASPSGRRWPQHSNHGPSQQCRLDPPRGWGGRDRVRGREHSERLHITLCDNFDS